MVICNKIISDSFKYKSLPINERSEEIFDLLDILSYCNQISERLCGDETLMDIYVTEKLTFSEWLFNGESDDTHQFFLQLYQNLIYTSEEYDKKIDISLGEYEDAIWKRDMYVKERRNILAQIKDPNQYEKFMHSCFTESVFSKNVAYELCHHIAHFSEHTEEITKNLAYLNDNAVKLYIKHSKNIKEAVDIINSELMKCSDDPKHKEMLYFKFEFDKDGQTNSKNILCSLHTKLIRSDSNLRIYFNWCDTDIDNGSKVLIGLIGRHPY